MGKIPGCILDISRHTKPLRLGIDVEHTAAYPEKLVREVMKPVIQKDDVILDPFSGSATTGAVALEFGCRYVGFDSNSTFCELGRERLVRLTK